MVTLFVRHQAADYDSWRKTYDSFEGTRKRLGVKGAAVYRQTEDPNNITVTHDFADLAAAQSFAGSTELREAMSKAGVVGAPTMWFTNRA